MKFKLLCSQVQELPEQLHEPPVLPQNRKLGFLGLHGRRQAGRRGPVFRAGLRLLRAGVQQVGRKVFRRALRALLAAKLTDEHFCEKIVSIPGYLII